MADRTEKIVGEILGVESESGLGAKNATRFDIEFSDGEVYITWDEKKAKQFRRQAGMKGTATVGYRTKGDFTNQYFNEFEPLEGEVPSANGDIDAPIPDKTQSERHYKNRISATSAAATLMAGSGDVESFKRVADQINYYIENGGWGA